MKLLYALLISATLLVAPSFAKGGRSAGKSSASSKTTHVKGYTKKDGTHVDPHVRTSPNGTETDNYSTKGNVNPVTGKEGTKDPKKKSLR